MSLLLLPLLSPSLADRKWHSLTLLERQSKRLKSNSKSLNSRLEGSHSVERRAVDDLKIVCYYSNWAVYRPGLAKFTPQNINPYLCVSNCSLLVFDPDWHYPPILCPFARRTWSMRSEAYRVSSSWRRSIPTTTWTKVMTPFQLLKLFNYLISSPNSVKLFIYNLMLS